MKLLEFLNPTLTWRSLAMLALLGGFVMAVVLWFWDPSGHRELATKLRLGLTEPEIVELMGRAPDHAYDRKSAPRDYYVPNYSRKERPIDNRVIVFILGQPIVYVWFDKAGRVEDYFVGGT